ncbi:MAG: hypothetical protein ACPLRO_08730 [Candidatus Kapaibacteriota bacterium]
MIILFRRFIYSFVLCCFFANYAFTQEILERGRFSGYMFGDYYYNILRDKNVASLPFAIFKDPQDQNGFEFRRIYFTYDYQISEQFNSRLRFEIEQSTLATNSKIAPFLKDAYIQWKDIFKGSNLTFGLQPTPSFDISEYVWENRHIEMTIIDLYGFIGSRDFGVSLKGKIDNKGIVNYWFLFGNGSGVRPELDKYKTLYGNILLKLNDKIWTYLNYHHKFSKPKDNVFSNGNLLSTDEDLFSFFLSYYQKDIFKFGVEAFVNYLRNNIKDSTNQTYLNRSIFGITVFGIYYFSPKYNLVLRYDFFDPNIEKNFSKDRRNIFYLGLNYKPVKKVSITPAVLVETFESQNNSSYKPSVTARLIFFYIFD